MTKPKTNGRHIWSAGNTCRSMMIDNWQINNNIQYLAKLDN